MKPSEILLAARELVAAGHCIGAACRDSSGRINPFYSEPATFCTVGAVKFVMSDSYTSVPWSYIRRAGNIPESPGKRDVAEVHDASTHLENVVRLEKAALLAMSEGQ